MLLLAKKPRQQSYQLLPASSICTPASEPGQCPHPKTDLDQYQSQFSCSVVSNSLRPHGLQYARLPCLSPAPGVCSNSCPLSQWCHPTISSSIIPFFSHLQSFPISGLISFRMDWLDLLEVQGTLKSLLQHHRSKASILWCSAFFIVQLSHSYVTIGRTIALTRWTFVGKVMSLLFNMLSRWS